jgi:hypothetical protein
LGVLSIQATRILKSLDRLSPPVPTGVPNPVDEKRTAVQQKDSWLFAFFKFVFWPFLLALALALRLTKVTADVTDWAT